MHVPTHILSGWCAANCFPLAPRHRLFCMIAAACPDLDGLTFFFGEEAYWRTHHVLAHNLIFAIAASATLSALSPRRTRLATFPLYLALVHLHFVMDYFGSGTGWIIPYLSPLATWDWKNPDAWPLTSWQNTLAFVVLLAWTTWIAARKERTPLELIAPRLDATAVGRLRNLARRAPSVADQASH